METSIADLPDAPKYNIKAVSAQTGIRAVTLRAWERRYDLLQPHRTPGNYRLYSERDVALLRWLKQRVDAGLSISSAAAELAELRQNSTWQIPPVHMGAADRSDNLPVAPEEPARLFQLLRSHNEAAALAFLADLHLAHDTEAVCVDVIIPCLVMIGDAWAAGNLRISTEHFASALLRGHVMSLFQALPMQRSAPYTLVGCAPQEMHDIGPLILALFLRRRGLRIEFLGPDLHLGDLADFSQTVRPAMIILSAGTQESALALSQFRSRLARLRPRPIFAYGGRAFNGSPELQSAVPGHYLGPTVIEASEAALKLVLP